MSANELSIAIESWVWLMPALLGFGMQGIALLRHRGVMYEQSRRHDEVMRKLSNVETQLGTLRIELSKNFRDLKRSISAT